MALPLKPVSLQGTAPTIFTGERSLSKTFMRDFKIYKIMNPLADVMKQPYACVATALSLIWGPKVDDWVDEQLKELEQKVHTIPRSNKMLWTEFEAAFTSAFMDTVMVLRPHRPRGTARPSTSSSNTSGSSASQSALEAVTPDTPDRRTAWVLAARWAARQEQYDKSAFPAQLAKVLRGHSMAVQAGCTSTHVMQGITNELMRLQCV
jgi:hypothetical protein